MPKYRFRFAKDFDVPASDPDAAELVLRHVACEQGSIELKKELGDGAFAYLGESEVVNIDEADRERARPLINGPDLLLMSCQYRGENFTALCSKKEVRDGRVIIRPLALLLREEKMEHLTDVVGDQPITVNEKELSND